MLEFVFILLPKTVNEYIYITGILGLVVLYFKRKKSIYFHIILCILFGSILWRSIYDIKSSRYASCLIYPFSIFSALFFSELIRSKNKINTLLVIPPIIGLICSWSHKNFSHRGVDYNLNVVTEALDFYNKQSNDFILSVPEKEYHRILHGKEIDKRYITANNIKTIQETNEYIDNYKELSIKVLYSIVLPQNKESELILKSPSKTSKHKHILSSYVQRNKKNKIHLYLLESNCEVITMSQNKTIEPESSLLTNGDLELLDTSEQSFQKLKNHVPDYDLYYSFNDLVRTPVNAYFNNVKEYTPFYPYYNCLNEKSISGNNSARIITNEGYGSLIFYQRFSSGNYQYSIDLLGKTNTKVCLFYDSFSDNKWKVYELVHFTIPNAGVFRIKANFSVFFNNSSDYFLVGAWVKGDAYLDNFCLTQDKK